MDKGENGRGGFLGKVGDIRKIWIVFGNKKQPESELGFYISVLAYFCFI